MTTSPRAIRVALSPHFNSLPTLLTFFSKSTFLKIAFHQGIPSVSNSLDLDQNVGPDVAPNCLQTLSTDKTSR